MNRSDFNGKTAEELEQMFNTEFEAYKAKIDSMMDLNELMAAEQELMNEAQEYDKYLDEVSYNLPDKVDFDGVNYSRNDITKFIVRAINKMEVEWGATLGLYELCKLWKNNDLSTIAYKAFDSTLRVLNQNKYKGMDEWKEMLVVNRFLAECHQEYTLDTNYNVFISERHNCIINRAELVRKDNNIIDETAVIQ